MFLENQAKKIIDYKNNIHILDCKQNRYMNAKKLKHTITEINVFHTDINILMYFSM